MQELDQESARRSERRHGAERRRAYSCPGLSPQRMRDSLDAIKASGIGAASIGAVAGATNAAAFSGAFNSILTSALVLVQGNIGVTGTTTVTAWANQGSGANGVVAGAAATVVGPNSKTAIQFSAGTGKATFATALPAPGTTPFTMGGVFRIDTAATNNAMFGNSSSTAGISSLMSGTAGEVNQGGAGHNTTVGAPGVSVYGHLQAFFSNSTSDHIKFGTSPIATGVQTVAAAGTTDISLAFHFSNFGAITCPLFYVVPGDVSGSTLTSLKSAITSFFGAGVLL